MEGHLMTMQRQREDVEDWTIAHGPYVRCDRNKGVGAGAWLEPGHRLSGG
jgi:hypothetical protein